MQTNLLRTHTHFAGFDGLRLGAAISVIFSHAFLIATGTDDREPFVRLLGPENIAGLYGVFTFFIISGFLLARSLSANASAITYTVNRVLRILPAFVFYLVVVVLFIGPLFSSMRPGEYFSSPAIPAFVTTSLDGLTDSQLPGVFDYGTGRLPTVVNGSLCSLRYESCHVMERPAMRWKTAAAARIRSMVALCAPRRAAVLGAKVSFVVGTTLILLSAKRSWLFLESMGQVLAGVIA